MIDRVSLPLKLEGGWSSSARHANGGQVGGWTGRQANLLAGYLLAALLNYEVGHRSEDPLQ